MKSSASRTLPLASNRFARLFQNPHKSAALTYGLCGALVILITFLAGLIPEGRQNAALELGVGLVFIILFAALIYRGWWLVSALLVFSNAWRALTFFNDGRGLHVELLPFRVVPIQPQPVAFINAILMLVVTFMLARSAWYGFTRWTARRRGQHPGPRQER